MILFKQKDVLAIVGRKDSTTLGEWTRNRNWFPPANIPGKPPRWTEKTLKTWINEGIPLMFEAGARLPELSTLDSTLAYQAACLGRLEAIKERRERIGSITRVFRVVPRSA